MNIWSFFRLRGFFTSALFSVLLNIGFSNLSHAIYEGDGEENAKTNLIFFDVPKIVLMAGLGFTHGTYNQNNGALQHSQLALTGKLTLATGLFRRKIPIEVTGFSTLLPMWWTPSSLPSITTVGLNLRTGFRTKINSLHVGLLVGEYFWRMIVPNQQFGVQYVYGPQAFFTLSKGVLWGLYFKYALISPPGSFNFLNREIAVGGAFKGPLGKLPLSFTLDVADMRTPTLSPDLVIDFLTVTVGMQLRI